MNRRALLAGFSLLLVVAAGFGAWRTISHRAQESCQACARPIHSHSRTVAMVDGERRWFCCPSCAFSEHSQSGARVTIVELTDYLTGAKIAPEEAYIVRESDVNPCLEHKPALSEAKQPLHLHFDRCVPSLLAFADQQQAMSFAREHGGRVVRHLEPALR